MLTPSEVSTKLKIQPSTLRKYSALLEQEGIQFKRTHKNARLYTDSEYIAIKGIIATVHSGKNHLKRLLQRASRSLKKNISIAPRERDSDDIAAATLNEVKTAENPAAATRRASKRTRYDVCGSPGEDAAENRCIGRTTEAITRTSTVRTRIRSVRIVLTAARNRT